LEADACEIVKVDVTEIVSDKDNWIDFTQDAVRWRRAVEVVLVFCYARGTEIALQ
jgi:hypothetical protein